jgi:plasmid stabilization system protein ParE
VPDEEIEALSQRLALCGVRFTPRARGDLEAIIDYLSHQNLQGARNVRRSLEATINLIGHFPESGRLAGEEGVRVLPTGRYLYLVYWMVKGGEAWVVHFRDRRLKTWHCSESVT